MKFDCLLGKYLSLKPSNPNPRHKQANLPPFSSGWTTPSPPDVPRAWTLCNGCCRVLATWKRRRAVNRGSSKAAFVEVDVFYCLSARFHHHTLPPPQEKGLDLANKQPKKVFTPNKQPKKKVYPNKNKCLDCFLGSSLPRYTPAARLRKARELNGKMRGGSRCLGQFGIAQWIFGSAQARLGVFCGLLVYGLY